jgi:cytochrome c peroxidase
VRRSVRGGVLLILLVVGCGDRDPFADAEVRARILAHAGLGAVPSDPSNAVADDPAAARLGQALFYDPRLSADGHVSCGTCHDPNRGWSNGQRFGQGLDKTRRHVPTLWNAAWQRWFFWDGRADSMWSQSLKPLEAPGEHGTSRTGIVGLMAGDAALREAYEGIFGALPELEPEDRAGVDRAFANVGKAIAAYERRIVSRGSAFDRFAERLRAGDPNAPELLDARARRGLLLFVGRAGCHNCHAGPNFTDGEFHDTGLAAGPGEPMDGGRAEAVAALTADPFNTIGTFADGDRSDPQRAVRFLSPRPEQRGQFKTPTLREVAHTAPYMHDGRFATLVDVVSHYSTLEGARFTGHHRESLLRPLLLDESEAADLVAFLESLSGEPLAAELVGPPARIGG